MIWVKKKKKKPSNTYIEIQRNFSVKAHYSPQEMEATAILMTVSNPPNHEFWGGCSHRKKRAKAHM